MDLEGVLREAAISIKALWKDRGFSATAIVTLAVCLGANVAIFTIVNSVLLRPLPVPESERIVFISNQYPGAGVPDIFSVGVPDYLDRRRQMTNVFEGDAMFRSEDQTVDVNGTPERMSGMRVTPSMFPLLRISPAIGHAFAEADGELGNEQKVILSYGLWQQLYAGKKDILGKDLRINGRPKTIVGVMARDFVFVDAKVRLWLPAAFNEREKSDDSRHSNNWSEIARLRPGATIQQAQAQVDAMNAANLERFPKFKPFLINSDSIRKSAGFKRSWSGMLRACSTSCGQARRSYCSLAGSISRTLLSPVRMFAGKRLRRSWLWAVRVSRSRGLFSSRV